MIQARKPVMIYDGDCNFCRIWINYWKQLTRDAVEYRPYQEAAEQFPQIPRDHFVRSVHLVMEDGDVLLGAHAVFQSLAYHPGKHWILWMYVKLPGFGFATECCYRFISQHRNAAYRATRILWGRQIDVPSYVFVRWIFLRMLGIIYFIAFASLGVQILGLVGSHGILPIRQYLQLVQENIGAERYWEFPTLAWFSSSDGFLQFLCWGGLVLSVCLILGIVQRISALLLWVLYLSMLYIGQTFLSFQWDILLLETGFLSIFIAPMNLLPRILEESSPSVSILFLFRLLLFRLMFFSGYVKLAVHDPFWTKLTALTVHYETQPLPTPLSWYFHQMPERIHALSCFVMFTIELGVPFFIFFPRRLRITAALLITLLMVLIAVSGNYTFFNFLAIVLCVFLLDDVAWQKLVPKKFIHRSPGTIVPARTRFRTAIVVVVILFLNFVRWAELFGNRSSIPHPVQAVSHIFAPMFIVNSYGLFRGMTNPRYEIVIEGSANGREWREYEFKYKPGDIMRAPPWVEPHQPRLDWQMWFAALGNYRQNRWFVNLCVRLLEGDTIVLDLLKSNPFSGDPPRYVRAQLYEYHFTNLGERESTGAWWNRALKGLYMPAISLR